jgi:hypothetical protein
MKKAGKLFLSLFILIVFFSCEESGPITTSNNLPSNVKIKKFVATSIKQLHIDPVLVGTTDEALLGSRVFKGPTGADMYRVRVRPVFTFDIDSTSRYRKLDVNGDLTDESRFVGTHKFIFKVDSAESSSTYNSNFNQQVDLKLVAEDITTTNGFFRDPDGAWFNSKYSKIEDAERVHKLGTTVGNVASSQAGVTNTYEVDITTENLNKIYNRYELNTGSGIKNYFSVAGFALDYTSEPNGMVKFKSLPYIKISYIPQDSVNVTTDSLYATSVLWFVTYETLDPSADETYPKIKSTSRDGIMVGFDGEEIRDFLLNNRYFGSIFSMKYAGPETELSPIRMYNIGHYYGLDSTDTRYNDGLGYDSLSVEITSSVELSKDVDKNRFYTSQVGSQASIIYNGYMRHWINETTDLGQVLLYRFEEGQYPQVTTFHNLTSVDSPYVLTVYYTEREQ